MDTNYAIATLGRAIGTFLISWVSFSLIAQWTKTDVYDANGNVIWGNTAWMIFLAVLVSVLLVFLVELFVGLFFGWSTVSK